MMPSEVRRGDTESSSSSGRLLRDIEEISKALYINKTPQKTLISSSNHHRSKSVEKHRLSASRSSLNPRVFDECRSYRDKKSPAVWNWKKPLKALAHIHHQKFNVCFFLHVHAIEGLPPTFNDVSLSVHWKRKDDISQTNLSRVSKGIAEFDETLLHKCCVYGSGSGPDHSAKYEPKLFLIYASLMGAPGVDLGRHRIDLTRLLPLTLDELEEEKSPGKWTTSFKLAGKAKGATLNVSFGFSVMKGKLNEVRRNVYAPELDSLAHGRLHVVDPITGLEQIDRNRILRRVESVPSDLTPHSPQSVDVKISGDVSRRMRLELSKSIDFLYEKLNETDCHGSEEFGVSCGDREPLESEPGIEFEGDKAISIDEDEMFEFTVIDHGIEIPEIEHIDSEQVAVQAGEGSAIENINMGETVEDHVALDDKTGFCSVDKISDNGDEVSVDDFEYEDSGTYSEGSNMEDLESALNSFLISESTMLGSSLVINEFLEQKYMESRSSYKSSKVVKKSSCLDETTEAVASDFLNMLGIDHSPFATSSSSEPESPRERLLREFETDPLALGNFITEYDENMEHEGYGKIALAGSNSSGISEDFDLSLVIQVAEEEHQRASQLLSRRKKAKALEDLETEALMREWGLNEMDFQNSPCHCPDGFGSPVELLPEEPVELPSLGDGFGPFIQIKAGGCLRTMNPSLFRNSKNVSSLLMQVSRPIVLPAEMGSDIMEIFQHLASIGIEKLSILAKTLMPLEDIMGRTLQNISEDAKSEVAILESRTGVEGLYSGWFFNSMNSTLVDVQMDSEYVTLEDLAPLAINKIEDMLIEGLRIQSGLSQQEAPTIIKSHPFEKKHSFKAKCADLTGLLSLEQAATTPEVEDTDSGSESSDGLLDLSITLEEWLRLDAGIISDENQVSERTVMILAAHHAKSLEIINGRLATDIQHGFLGNNLTLALTVLLRDPLRDYEPVGTSMLALIQLEKVIDTRKNEEEHHEGSQTFKLIEVHLSGLNTDPGRIQPWGSKTQQQSGTRWLLASGLSKAYNSPVSKSNAIVVSNPRLMRKMQTDEILWSISCQGSRTQTSKQETAALVTEEELKQMLEETTKLLERGVYEPDEVAVELGENFKKVTIQTVTPHEDLDESEYVHKVRSQRTSDGETLIEVYLTKRDE